MNELELLLYFKFYFFSMPSKKLKKKSNNQIIESTREPRTTSRTAKTVLFVFGVGPLLLMCLFLFSNGFFSAP